MSPWLTGALCVSGLGIVLGVITYISICINMRRKQNHLRELQRKEERGRRLRQPDDSLWCEIEDEFFSLKTSGT